MKILFVITNINGFYNDAYSFGLASLASIAKDKGCEYDYQVITRQDDFERFPDLVEKMRPDIICYTSVSSQFMYVKQLASKVKGPIQIGGGVHPTIFPECLFEAPSLNGIFIGESELAFSDFIDNPGKDTRNFAYAEDGKLVKNELYPLIKDLDSLPFPEREKYGYQRFIDSDGHATFLFNRGCPYLCSYCSNHALANIYGMKVNKPRFKSPGRCIEEIRQVAKTFSFNRIFFGDDIFGLDRNWLEDFCSLYAKDIKLPFTCQLRVNIVNEDMVRTLKKAGCIRISCGIESGNDFIRNEVMKRNISREQIIKAYGLFRKYGIPTNAINIIGLPHETEKEIWDTIKLNRIIKATGTGTNIFYPYKGTTLGDYCFEKNLVNSGYDDFSKERRESVLNFSQEHKKRLIDIQKNWSLLVYRTDPVRLAGLLLRNFLATRLPYIFEALKMIRDRIYEGRYPKKQRARP